MGQFFTKQKRGLEPSSVYLTKQNPALELSSVYLPLDHFYSAPWPSRGPSPPDPPINSFPALSALPLCCQRDPPYRGVPSVPQLQIREGALGKVAASGFRGEVAYSRATEGETAHLLPVNVNPGGNRPNA